MEAFYFENAEAAMKFYDACEAAGAKTIEERMAIMRQMVKDKKAKYIRDADEFVKGHNVIKFTKGDTK